MLNALVRFSIRYRGIVVALGCAFLAYGVFSVYRVPYSDFPDFAPPEVAIQTEAPGLSSEQVEILVTQPIENSINGVSGIDSLRSKSIQGLSVITVVFRFGTDIYRDRQAVSERLSTVAGELPGGVEPPLMTPLTTTTSWVMHVGLTSDKQSLMALRTVADWTVKPRLLAVRGVAEVEVNGGERRQLQVQFDPQKLVQFGVSVEDVLAAARQATGVRGGGFVETPNQRIVLQTEGQSLTAAQLAQTVVVHHEGGNVTLGDVARVADAPAPAIGEASIRGTPGVIMVVDSAYGANALEVTRGLDAALADLRPGLEAQGITVHCGRLSLRRHDRHRAAKCAAVVVCGLHPGDGGAVFVFVQPAHRRNFLHRDSSLSAGGGDRAGHDGPEPEHDDPGRAFDCHRRSGGRRGDRRGEHLSPPAREPGAAASQAGRAGCAARLGRSALCGGLCDLCGAVGICAGAEHVRAGWQAVLSAGPCLHLGHCSFADRGADSHSRALHSAAG